ncbi:prephenate dehydrogenase/arogenate dehydrogenase family protein [Corallococcus exercitus]|uniref:Prephenate dehydrogenase/arogenate dehydrogenase family protein n=1 Tax=Corallococcus exercitus TaxID=2316736 RepID=A0A3A8HIB9_9BACT|nr:prephenate dehydrogenase dimerization domain-containing protein [Corallococcus exercitus]NOK38481.1 prephenate dehydrogenase/arogenate dehydrogenase family protein [Corallococcus exercitus]RKG71009.1 prephenate dehydrogenase/arogenate dehydrogenase family protein [Corallococcus exercitus]
MSASPLLVDVVVLGANGAFGRTLAGLLHAGGHRVTGVDLAPAAVEQAPLARYVAGDATSPSAQVRESLSRADVVLASLHEDVALASLGAVLPALKPGALFVDTLSIKSPLAARVASARDDVEQLGLNPLFGPSVGFTGQNVAAVSARRGPRTDAMLALVESWGARVTVLSPEEHDRAMAAIQVATHAALVSFGAALHGLGFRVEALRQLTTPPHRLMLAALARLVTGNPEVYWEIQHSNPFAPEARRALQDGVERVRDVTAAGDVEAWRGLLGDCRQALGSEAEAFAALCAELFRRV